MTASGIRTCKICTVRRESETLCCYACGNYVCAPCGLKMCTIVFSPKSQMALLNLKCPYCRNIGQIASFDEKYEAFNSLESESNMYDGAEVVNELVVTGLGIDRGVSLKVEVPELAFPPNMRAKMFSVEGELGCNALRVDIFPTRLQFKYCTGDHCTGDHLVSHVQNQPLFGSFYRFAKIEG